MNENFYNQRKMRSVQVPAELNKNGHSNNGAQLPQNFSHNNVHSRQPLNQTPTANHIQQNMLPQLVNLISPQISVSQPGNQPMINMGFNTSPFLPNQVYSLPNTFGPLNTMASQGYGTSNVSYMNNIRLNNGQQAQSVVSFKEPKMVSMGLDPRKNKTDTGGNSKVTNYPVRLLVNSELVGPLIGRKGEKIKDITATTGAKIDIKRESVPYSQFGLNNYMFSGSNRKGSGSGDNEHVVTANSHTNRGESQIVFIVGDPEKCTAAIQEIMQLCTQEAAEQGREEPNLGLLAEDRFCARIIGKEGRYLNFVRCKSNSQVHVSNVPTITTLSQQPHIISLDRIVSCRGGGLASLLEAERLISEKVRQCVAEDGQNVVVQKPLSRLSKDDSFLPPRAAAEMNLFGQYYPGPPPPHASLQAPQMTMPHLDDVFMARRPPPMMPPGSIGSGIVHKANPNWPDNLKLDENLYVRIAQMCAGSIIGSEGKSVKRIMADTGTYVQISKANLSPVESVPAVHTYRKMAIPSAGLNTTISGSGSAKDDLDQRLVTIKGSVPSQCGALAHIFHRVKLCYNQSGQGVVAHDFQDVRLWVLVRVPKLMLGRLIGKDGKVIRQLQLSSRTFLSFPRLRRPAITTEDSLLKSGDVPVSEEESGVISGDAEITVDTALSTDRPGNTTMIAAKPGVTTATTDKPISPAIATIASLNAPTDLLHNPDAAIFGDPDLHPVEIFGPYDAVEHAVLMIRRLVYSSIFAQYGPALIPGPLSSSVASAGVSGPLAHPSHMQPAFLVSPMMAPPAWHPHQRRTASDFPLAPYYNSLAAASVPARSFGATGMCLPPHTNTKSYKRPPYNQRMRGDRRSQSEMKPPLSRTESGEDNTCVGDEPNDNGECNEDEVSLEHTEHRPANHHNNSIIGSPATSDPSAVVSMSPKRILVKERTDAQSVSPDIAQTPLFRARGPPPQWMMGVSSVDDLSHKYVVGSPPGSTTNTSYYTDCGPTSPSGTLGTHGNNSHLNMSGTTSMGTGLDDLSFMTAQDSLGDDSPFLAHHPGLAQASSSGSSPTQPPHPPTQSTPFSHWVASTTAASVATSSPKPPPF